MYLEYHAYPFFFKTPFISSDFGFSSVGTASPSAKFFTTGLAVGLLDAPTLPPSFFIELFRKFNIQFWSTLFYSYPKSLVSLSRQEKTSHKGRWYLCNDFGNFSVPNSTSSQDTRRMNEHDSLRSKEVLNKKNHCR